MPLVPAKCTQCGSTLDIDPSKDVAVCPYCHVRFVTENAINNYNTTNVTNVSNLHANNVTLNTNDDRQRLANAGEDFLRLKNYGSAEKNFRELSNLYPGDYTGWWGLIRVESKNLNVNEMYDEMGIVRNGNTSMYIGNVYDYIERLDHLFDNVKVVAPGNVLNDLTSKYTQYISGIKRNIQSDKISAIDDYNRYDNMYSVMKESYRKSTALTQSAQLEQLKRNIKQQTKEKKYIPSPKVFPYIILLFIAVFIAVFIAPGSLFKILPICVVALFIFHKLYVKAENKKRETINAENIKIAADNVVIQHKIEALQRDIECFSKTDISVPIDPSEYSKFEELKHKLRYLGLDDQYDHLAREVHFCEKN